ncbi:MAG: hypothetical protein JNL48_20430, partial [Acidobacteria bacterium]|nr:hypothetical protein [Acidobacteriota bacterium]
MPARVLALASLLVGVLLASGCGPSTPAHPNAAGAAPAAADSAAATPAADAPWFEDVAAASGLSFVHRSGHEGTTYRLPEIMGGGAALFDMDGDGDLDALLVQSGTLGAYDRGPRHRLFRN